MSEGTLAASLRVRFTFATLAELSAWRSSSEVEEFLVLLAQASGEPPQLSVHGSLEVE
jgi:hypothetical protein